GVGSSYTTEPIPDASAQTLDTAVGDVDGDGRPDVLRATVNTLRVHHNRADGWTTTDYLGIAPSNSAGTVAATELDSVAIGDVTGDGRPDMIATNSSDRPAGVVNVFQQNADGSLATPVMYSAGDKPQSVEVTDIDGDGRNDLAMINNGSGGLTFLYQQSDGTFG